MYRLIGEERMDGDEARWRPPSILFIPIILCAGLIFFVDVFQFQYFKIPTTVIPVPRPHYVGYSEDASLKGFLIKTEGCRIPDMNAFDSSILSYIFEESPVSCNNNNTPPLMESNLTSVYLLKTSLPYYGVSDTSALKCCYYIFHRTEPKPKESDNKINFSKDCLEFNHTVTITDEFVRVVCSYNGTEIYRDFFAFVPMKNNTRNSSLSRNAKKNLNVLIIGIDAVSRLNLHRQMPQTVQLLQEISAVEFFGYNKVGDNTFPNLIPVLTGLAEEELTDTCWTSKNARFDKCPFVWKNFSRQNFITAFGEDAAWMGIFNYMRRGFKKQPTDYFWGPFNAVSETEIGNEHKLNVYQCVGGRQVYKTLLEYMEKFVHAMQSYDKSYFAFFWGASLSHDYLNKPKLGDVDYAKFINKLRLNGALNNTVLIFMSDHGIRWGGIRSTYQGRMEERLPFLFISLPEQFRDSYYHLQTNMRKNSRKLTTPFDLHETLKDLLSPYSLTKNNLNLRFKNREYKREYSLFELLPTNRTCEEAGIAPHWCTCQQSADINKNNSIVREAALFTVNYINDKLEGYAECANLSLREILNARLHRSTEHVLVGKNITQDYTIVLKTAPGNGIFEVTVRQHICKEQDLYNFTITGTISRINLYGKQSLCITDFHLKLYCYCKT